MGNLHGWCMVNFDEQTKEMDTMNDEQLKEYLQNRPPELKTTKIQSSKPSQKVSK